MTRGRSNEIGMYLFSREVGGDGDSVRVPRTFRRTRDRQQYTAMTLPSADFILCKDEYDDVEIMGKLLQIVTVESHFSQL